MGNYVFSKRLLEELLGASKRMHPQEFFALLGTKSKKDFVEEFVVVPASFSEGSVSYYLGTLPFDASVVGSFHSHPGHSNFPSKQDLKSFPKTGEIHLISCSPYTLKATRAFGARGKELELCVK